MKTTNKDQTPCKQLIVISSVPPELTTGGSLLLHRHLSQLKGWQIDFYGGTMPVKGVSKWLRRFLGFLDRFDALVPWVRILWEIWDGRWIDAALPNGHYKSNSTIVLTVAHGDLSGAARRFAIKNKLHLVTLFHDWWPDLTGAHDSFHHIVNKRFKNLYDQSSLVICVSQAMRDHLGNHPNVLVLPPVAGAAQSSVITHFQDSKKPLNVFYFGNLSDYGDLLAKALVESTKTQGISLQVRGANPPWPEVFMDQMKNHGLWHDFAPTKVLQEWVSSADVFLICMVFDPKMKRRMETSFPSKLVEMAHYGKPLIIWGPEYCSAVKWARATDSAFCVTESDPVVLLKELEELKLKPKEYIRLSKAARKAAWTEFNSQKIQFKFSKALDELIS